MKRIPKKRLKGCWRVCETPMLPLEWSARILNDRIRWKIIHRRGARTGSHRLRPIWLVTQARPVASWPLACWRCLSRPFRGRLNNSRDSPTWTFFPTSAHQFGTKSAPVRSCLRRLQKQSRTTRPCPYQCQSERSGRKPNPRRLEVAHEQRLCRPERGYTPTAPRTADAFDRAGAPPVTHRAQGRPDRARHA